MTTHAKSRDGVIRQEASTLDQEYSMRFILEAHLSSVEFETDDLRSMSAPCDDICMM